MLRKKSLSGIYGYYNNKDKETIIAYYINYRDINGNPIKRKTDANTPQEAKLILDSVKQDISIKKSIFSREEINSKRSISVERITVDEIAELFFADRNTKNNTRDEQAYYNRVSNILGKRKVISVNDNDMKKLFLFLKSKKNYSPKTINETYNLLRSIFNKGIKKKWCSNNPILELEIDRMEVVHEPGRIFSNDDLDILFKTLKNGNIDLDIMPNSTLYLFMKCLYYTGARPQAVLEIKYQDIIQSQNQIKLKAMKKGKAYTQEVNTNLIELLNTWIKEHDLRYGNYIFYPQQTYNRSKNPKDKNTHTIYENIRRGSRKIFDKLFNINIPVTDRMNRVSLYSFRRTSGTKIYRAKGIMEAMVFLNHTSVKTTQKYLNVENDIKGLIDVL